jgi:hypothetical protein
MEKLEPYFREVPDSKKMASSRSSSHSPPLASRGVVLSNDLLKKHWLL